MANYQNEPRLEMMLVELDFALIMVSHVNDNGETRGSRMIGKICNTRIDLTRDVSSCDGFRMPADADLSTGIRAGVRKPPKNDAAA
jgi:hypothetical protein